MRWWEKEAKLCWYRRIEQERLAWACRFTDFQLRLSSVWRLCSVEKKK